MPKLYEYFGLTVFFYANEHLPIHVHGRCQGKECKAEIIIEDGKIEEIIVSNVAGKPPLDRRQRKDFEIFVRAKAEEIVAKWVAFFVNNKPLTAESVTRRIK